MTLSSPEAVSVFTEAGRDDSAAEIGFDVESGAVSISSSEPLCRVILRWSVPTPEGAQVLGDAWERGYGDLEWRGLIAERPLPWYALIAQGNSTTGWGVKTGAKSFASWRVDSSGVTLVLDVRSGGRGRTARRKGFRGRDGSNARIDAGREHVRFL